jgi:hypothetical protein
MFRTSINENVSQSVLKYLTQFIREQKTTTFRNFKTLTKYARI